MKQLQKLKEGEIIIGSTLPSTTITEKQSLPSNLSCEDEKRKNKFALIEVKAPCSTDITANIIGQQGQSIKKMKLEAGVDGSLSVKWDEANNMMILRSRGPMSDKSREKLQQLLEDQVRLHEHILMEEKIPCSTDIVSYIVGPNGQSINGMKKAAGIVGRVSVEWDGAMLILRSKYPISKKSIESLRQIVEDKVQRENDMKVQVRCGEEKAILFLAKYKPTDLPKLEGCSGAWMNCNDPPRLEWDSKRKVLVIQSKTVLSLDEKTRIGRAVKKKCDELAEEAAVAAAEKKQKKREKEKKAARKHLPQLNYDPRRMMMEDI